MSKIKGVVVQKQSNYLRGGLMTNTMHTIIQLNAVYLKLNTEEKEQFEQLISELSN